MKKIFTCFFNVILLLVSLTGISYAQSRNGSVSGAIKTSDGNPASFVSVGLKNTSKTTQSDEKGNFTLKNVSPGNYVLKISAIGVSAQEKNVSVVAGENTEVSLSIAESSSQLDEVAINGYKTPNKKPVNLGKIAIAPMDLPQAVQIIGNQVITDQQANRLSDVLKNVNGVAYGENRGSVSGETFFARGYSLGTNNVFKNGSRASSGGMPETSTLESVEILKGSAALLYGGVTGGAVVNMVTKKPKFEYGGEVSMRAGSYDMYKPTADIYGPISKKLAFRLIGTYEDAASFRNSVKSNRIYVNPSLLYKISDKTDILLQGDYLKSDMTPDFGIGTVENQIVDIGRGTFVNAPWAYNKTNTATSQLNINHKFSDNWKLNVLANFQSYNRNYFSAERPFADTKVASNPLPYGFAARNVTRSKTKEFTYNEQINLNGFFKTGSVTHTLLVGADADQSRTTSGGFTFNNNLATFNYGNVNLLDPATYFGSGIEPAANMITQTFAPLYRMGTFAQDLVSITDQFKVLAGVRYTFQKTPRTVSTNLASGVQTLSVNSLNKSKVESAFTPKFGLIYQPLKTTSIYASYASNFIQNTGTDINFAPLDPSTVDQYEAGIKNDLFKGRLSVNLTVYRIANDKFAQQAPLNAQGAPNGDANIKELNGKTLSDGLELDITGTIVKGLNFIAGYSYNYIRYTQTRDKTVYTVPEPTPAQPNATRTVTLGGIIEGQRLVGSTKNTANGTLFYTFQEGSVKGLKLGASAYYTGARNGGYNDSKIQTYSRLIPLSAFTTFDFSAGYSWKKLSLLAKISNITNELNYFVHENYSVNPIPPRQFMTTLSYKF
ncbi:iron complex outermembrane receptor protein [Pedobacter psychrotolerans]|uniref:Iron complex outermembrane receptor protein n=1 Tax=Pedobacter psychrotolerans TaxID=1843235 RepID=A0A4R2HNI3_9SPHI|nr:TonB-dependent receptor [Pedobacter psychrotolerans]TCO30734.1 iron complex outermembrane receptor protein [Pedobacter psychrotolerans]GGE44829.1 TonB-dependent receptor [Pedobacter psychrotolerans]